MKYTVLVIFLLIVRTVTAQSGQCGVYLTADDFKGAILTNAVDCKDNDHAINRNSFFNKPYITITHKEQKRKFNKSDIYGYRDCDGHIVRFSENRDYQIINTEEIYLYQYEQLEDGRKSANTISRYFFSVSADAPILPLTIFNLQKTFPDNHKFHDLLEALFKSDDELVKHDVFQKNYKLIRVFRDSKANN